MYPDMPSPNLEILTERVDRLIERYDNLHDRVGGPSHNREQGLEAKTQLLQIETDRLGAAIREVRAILTSNGGGKGIAVTFSEINNKLKNLDAFQSKWEMWMEKNRDDIAKAIAANQKSGSRWDSIVDTAIKVGVGALVAWLIQMAF